MHFNTFLVKNTTVWARAVARFMFSARFRPERKQAKIFAAFLLCTSISLKRTFFCYEIKSDNEG
jgi:hypothetical protein